MNVPSAANRLLYSVVRMEKLPPSAPGVGTAFIFTARLEDREAPFLVTSRRAVAGANQARLLFTLAGADGPALGQHVALTLPDFSEFWLGHPDPSVDLAVAPLAPLLQHANEIGQPLATAALDQSLIPSGDAIDQVEAIEDVIVLAYSSPFGDPDHLVPLTFKGSTASPFGIDYGNAPRFLVQIPFYPGMEGSPVLLRRRGLAPGPEGPVEATQFALLGLLSEPATPRVPSTGRADLVLAVKSRQILAGIDHFVRTYPPAPKPG